MDIGVGLPNAIPGSTGRGLLEWSVRAESLGFSSLSSTGRQAYPTYDELTVFAAAGAVTHGIRFMTNVLLAPTRSIAELAKQSASVDQLTGGRLTLGLGIGRRPEDYAVNDRDFATRGRRFAVQLAALAAAWDGTVPPGATRPVCPPPIQRPIPILLGGTSDSALSRVVRFGTGYSADGSHPDVAGAAIQRVRASWRDARRAGTPRVVVVAYFSLGDDDAEAARGFLVDYYGPDAAQPGGIGDRVLRTPGQLGQAIADFAALGADEMIFNPTASGLRQLERLAAALDPGLLHPARDRRRDLGDR